MGKFSDDLSCKDVLKLFIFYISTYLVYKKTKEVGQEKSGTVKRENYRVHLERRKDSGKE